MKAIYARVSTLDQDPDLQLRDLRRFCELKGYDVPLEFVDHGVSGTKLNRPEFDQMLALVRAGKIDTVIVWRFDRASRSTKQLILLLEEFGQLKVNFISIREQIDTSTPAGKLMFTMISGMAEFERDLISERVKAGMACAKAKGVQMGKPRLLDWDRVAELKAQGHKSKSIALKLGISTSHVRRICGKLAA